MIFSNFCKYTTVAASPICFETQTREKIIDFLNTVADDGILIVSDVGWLEDFSCRYLLGCIDDLLKEGHREIMINCQNLGVISSSCLGSLVRAQLRAKTQGSAIVLANVDNSIHEAIGFLGLNRLFGMFTTLGVVLSRTRRKFGRKKSSTEHQLNTCC